MYEGLKQHYGITVRNFEVAYAEPRPRRQGRGTVPQGRRHRRCPAAAARRSATPGMRDARSRALNRLLDEARARA
ncbi:MAG: hypothetical protein U0802_10315 [Candidatus Binatia bacterium]